jgi:hypothetical protein
MRPVSTGGREGGGGTHHGDCENGVEASRARHAAREHARQRSCVVEQPRLRGRLERHRGRVAERAHVCAQLDHRTSQPLRERRRRAAARAARLAAGEGGERRLVLGALAAGQGGELRL